MDDNTGDNIKRSEIKATVKSQALFLNARLRHSQCDILILKEQPLSSMAPATSYTQKGTSKQAEAEFSSYQTDCRAYEFIPFFSHFYTEPIVESLCFCSHSTKTRKDQWCKCPMFDIQHSLVVLGFLRPF